MWREHKFVIGLRNVINDTVQLMKASNVSLTASSLAYTTILSIVPLLAVSFALFKSFGGLEQLYEKIQPFIFNNLAEGTNQQTIEAIQGFVDRIHAGALGTTGFAVLILTSMSMLSSVERAINRVWGAKLSRSWFQRITAYWFFITIGPLALAFAIGALSSSGVASGEFSGGGVWTSLLTLFFFWCAYHFIPNRKVHFVASLAGAVYTVLLWQFAKAIYGIYTSTVLTYSKIYGSLGAIPIFLIWIYIMWLIIISGSAISAAIQKRFELE